MPGNNVVKEQCQQCGGGFRNHRVLREYHNRWDDHINGEHGEETYQILKCQGCDAIRFRVEEWSTQDAIDPYTGEVDSTVRIFPEFIPDTRRAMIEPSSELPDQVDRIYRETVSALNAGTLILAGAGLRAIVEAICLNAKVPGRNLQDKIDGLVEQNLLAQPQADLLHEERYLGNAAVHEVEPSARKDIEDGLAIVEALLNTMYVVPLRAQRLRNKRTKKAAARKTSVTAASSGSTTNKTP